LSHYERRLEADKAAIRERVAAIGGRVEAAVREASAALLAGDHARCYRLILADMPINREVRSIDAACHAFVARHLPSAGHLRFISSVLRMNIALERIGDYAVTVCREAVQLEAPPPEAARAAITELTAEGAEVLREAMRAFSTEDATLAREIRSRAKLYAANYEELYRSLVAQEGSRSLKDLFAILAVFHRLERVSDQAKNVCEETLFCVTGETKAPKTYSVLFVDGRGTLVAPLAEAMARKAFPQSGRYDSAGFAAGDALAPEAINMAAELGLDLAGISPHPLRAGRKHLEKYHVAVGLTPGARAALGELPFHFVYLEWNLPTLDGPGAVEPRLRSLCQQLSAEIRELMTTLRGDDAP
jgi:phosphate transport system protein